VFDVRPFTERARRGITLLPEDLLRVRQTLVSAREVQRLLERLAQPYPHRPIPPGALNPAPA
jgi:dsDNA-specific endonuclease/ATPase MutS2